MNPETPTAGQAALRKEKTMTAYYTEFKSATTGNFETSRIFDTERKARNWAKWMLGKFASEVRIYRGGWGGELLVKESR